MGRWRKVQYDHPGFIDTYLPVLHDAPMPGSARLLFLTSAVEALHSSLVGEAPQPLDDYKAEQKGLMKKLKASGGLTKDERRALRSHLAPTNFYSLPERLCGLRDRLPTEVVERAGLHDLDQSVPRLRNKIAHGRTLDAENRASLDHLDLALTNLIDANLLTMLGLPFDTLLERLDEDERGH